MIKKKKKNVKREEEAARKCYKKGIAADVKVFNVHVYVSLFIQNTKKKIIFFFFRLFSPGMRSEVMWEGRRKRQIKRRSVHIIHIMLMHSDDAATAAVNNFCVLFQFILLLLLLFLYIFNGSKWLISHTRIMCQCIDVIFSIGIQLKKTNTKWKTKELRFDHSIRAQSNK